MALTVSFISFARSWSLARRLFALQAAVVLVVLSGASLAAYLQFSRANTEAAAREMLGVAHTLAADPAVLAALDTPVPSTALQPLAEEVRIRTDTDFVVVMSTDGIRYSHPTVGEIGRHYLGSIAEAARGESYTETYAGTLGPSVRAVVPVWRAGHVMALVSVGRTLQAVAAGLAAEIPLIVAGGVSALLIAAVGAWLVSRWLRRTTLDLAPVELRRRNTYYDAVLHAVREGMLLLDGAGHIQLVNDEARRLLRLPDDVVGRRVDAVGLPAALAAALAERAVGPDEIHLTDDRIVVVNQAPARDRGRDLGTVVTLRDHTELRALVSELQTVRGFADSLNAQAHEAANHLHTVVALIELGRSEEAVEYASGELEIAQQLTDLVLGAFAVPELAAFVVGKAAQASERDVELVVEPATAVPAGVADPRDLITIVGNLLDNAVDAALETPAPRRVRLGAGVVAGELVLQVGDSGPGLPPDVAARAFVRGVSTKPARPGLGRGLGLALVQQAVHRNGGRVDVGTGPDGGALFVIALPVPVPAAPWTVAGARVP